jgi:MFS family permease
VAASIVENHTLEVTTLAPLLGGNFEDLSEVNGHLYSNKAPGGALLGLPAYALARAYAGPPAPGSMRATLTAMRLLAATLPTLLLALLVIRAGRRVGVAEPRLALVVTVLLFATPLFAYGMLNFSHALTACGLFAAWWLLFVEPHEYAAGACLGMAVLAEYPCALPAAVLLACAVLRGRGRLRIGALLRAIAGGAPFAIALGVYNQLAFGSPFALSSGAERNAQFREMASSGLFGIGLPDPVILAKLLFDPSKGLLLFSPILALAFLGGRKLPREQRLPLILVPLSLLLLYAGYPNWHGGWTVGARYLVPALPFLVFLLATAKESKLELILLGWSAAAVVTTSLVFPFIPPDVPLPWSTFALPMLRHGLVAPNLLHLVWQPAAVVVPIVLVLLALVSATQERAWLVVIGIAAAFLAGAFAPQSPRTLVERGFVDEVHFEQRGALQRSVPAGMALSPSLVRRAEAQRALPPPSWPFGTAHGR